MRYDHAPLLGLLFVTLLSGCGSAANPLPVGTFTNQSDPAKVLELALDPSQTTNIFIRISIETGANKYFGKSVGRYTLKTRDTSSGGTFLWAKSPRDGSVGEVWFTAADGKKWTLKVEPDGSLLDSGGIAWKRPNVGVRG